MKKIILASLGALALMNTSSHAANPVPGWYAGGLVGATSVPSANYYYTQPIAGLNFPLNLSLNYKYYVDAALMLGYRCENFRLEGEALYSSNPLSKLVVNGLNIGSPSSSAGFRIKGGRTILGLMFNGYYDLNFASNGNESDIIPYVGVGLGYAHVSNNIKFYYNNALIPGSALSSKNSAPAGQAILGANYFIDDFWAFGLDYRYFTSKQIKATNSKAQFQSFNLTITGAFDSVLG